MIEVARSSSKLDPTGDSPEDPLLPKARAIIERHGGTVEQLGVQRQGIRRHASVRAKAIWPDAPSTCTAPERRTTRAR